MTQTNHDRYLGPTKVFYRLFKMLEAMGWDPARIVNILMSRWSQEVDEAAMESAVKVMNLHRKVLPAVGGLLDAIPDSAWLSEESREAAGILTIRVHDVTHLREVGDPHGNGIIGYAIVFDDTLFWRVRYSGYVSLTAEDGAPVSAHTEALINLMKWVRGGHPSDFRTRTDSPLHLRLSDDMLRNRGRRGIELDRLDEWIDRLAIAVWNGTSRVPDGEFGKLLKKMNNSGSETNRTTIVDNLTKARLKAISSGSLAVAECYLPPTLEHREDPNLGSADKRLREGSVLSCFHAVDRQPAFLEYLDALADGRSDRDLAFILRKHRVPTPRQIDQDKGRCYSTVRDTTFDQLPMEDATQRAGRLFTYVDHPLRPVLGKDRAVDVEATKEQNVMALRKLLLLFAGRFHYEQKNPTESSDVYGADDDGETFVVQRVSHLDIGKLVVENIEIGFPARFRIRNETRVVDSTGAPTAIDPGESRSSGRSDLFVVDIPVVTDEPELEGQTGLPEEWTGWGANPDLFDRVVRRLAERALSVSPGAGAHARLTARLLEIPDWFEYDTNGDLVRQYRMWKRGPSATPAHKTRWLIWRPGSEATRPSGHTVGWNATTATITQNPDRHLATCSEHLMLGSVVAAFETQVRKASLLETPLLAVHAPPLDTLSDRSILAKRRIELQDELDEQAALAAGARKAHLIALGRDDLTTAASYETDEQDAKARLCAITSQIADIDVKLNESEKVRHEAEIDIRSVARLIAALNECATPEAGGFGPSMLAEITRRTFVNWRIGINPTGEVEWRCDATIRTTDGETLLLPLHGVFTWTRDRSNAVETANHQMARSLLVERRSVEDMISGHNRTTSYERIVIRIRDALSALGVNPQLCSALIDHPIAEAGQSVWARLTAEAPSSQTWTSSYAVQMQATYLDSSRGWPNTAVPSPHATWVHQVFAILRATPGHAVAIGDIVAAVEGITSRNIAKLVTPSKAAPGSIGRPSFLMWANHSRSAVTFHPCPHADCPSRKGHRWADTPVWLPETTVAGQPSGVLCSSCRRIPIDSPKYRTLRFPESYTTVLFTVPEGARVREGVCTIPVTDETLRLPPVPAADSHLNITELASRYNLTRPIVQALVEEAGVKHRRHGQRVEYPAAAAQQAIDTGLRTEIDPAAYRPSSLSVAEAAALAGLSIDEVRALIDQGVIPAHRNRRGHLRIPREDATRLSRGC